MLKYVPPVAASESNEMLYNTWAALHYSCNRMHRGAVHQAGNCHILVQEANWHLQELYCCIIPCNEWAWAEMTHMVKTIVSVQLVQIVNAGLGDAGKSSNLKKGLELGVLRGVPPLVQTLW